MLGKNWVAISVPHISLSPVGPSVLLSCKNFYQLLKGFSFDDQSNESRSYTRMANPTLVENRLANPVPSSSISPVGHFVLHSWKQIPQLCSVALMTKAITIRRILGKWRTVGLNFFNGPFPVSFPLFHSLRLKQQLNNFV